MITPVHTDAFKIYIDRLGQGRVQAIDEELTPEFLAVDDKELQFKEPVRVQGRGYIAEEELIIHFDVETKVHAKCAICNGPAALKIQLKNWILTKPLQEISGGIFDYKEPLREEILVSIPFVIECDGECPKRGEYKKFFKQESGSDKEEGYRPFADL